MGAHGSTSVQAYGLNPQPARLPGSAAASCACSRKQTTAHIRAGKGVFLRRDMSTLENSAPIVHTVSSARPTRPEDLDDDVTDEFDAREIFDIRSYAEKMSSIT